MDRKNLEFINLGSRFEECLDSWAKADLGERIWRRDPGVWQPGARPDEAVPDLSNRLGWLDLPEKMTSRAAELESYARQTMDAGFSRVLVLGMGGSSLIAEVWAEVFGPAPGFLPLTVLDSTHPRAVAAAAAAAPLEKTLFLVASKSGGTLETLSFCHYFYDRLSFLKAAPGENFIALTDPGSRLEKLATARGFRKVFSTPSEVGGRFSALTEFGLLPAALLGLPLSRILGHAAEMAAACGPGVAVGENPALRLGAFLGSLGAAGCDKLCLALAPALRPFAVWLEQLLAESTGKQGRGLVPVILEGDEAEWLPAARPADRMGLLLSLEGDDCEKLERCWENFARCRVPAVRLTLSEPAALGAEIWRFEMATAAAAVEMGINPFDQPDVESAKIRARQAIKARHERGVLPVPTRLGPENEGVEFSGSPHFAGAADLRTALSVLLTAGRPDDYLGLLAYLPRLPGVGEAIDGLKNFLKDRCGLPVCVGFGPRYLHSTGQLHKGGADHGLFLMLAGDLEHDLPLPGEEFGFATLITAQFRGDFEALVGAGRRVLLLEGKSLSSLELVEVVRTCLGEPR